MDARRGRGPLVGGAALALALALALAGLAALRSDGTRPEAEGPQPVAPGNPEFAPAVPAHFGRGSGPESANADLRPASGLIATECAFSHESFDDPIVYPGEPGLAHRHNFFGNTTTDAYSTTESLLDQPTTCRLRADAAAYWAPALLADDRPLRPVRADAYYRVAPGVDPESVQAYPEGLMMIAGDHHAIEPQPLDVVAFACDRSLRVSATPPDCPDGVTLTMRVTFPDCWNGTDTDSADHKQHVTYSGPGGCPADHPVPVPALTFVVHWLVDEPLDSLSLSPGSILNGHADFVNTWDQRKLETEIDKCLRRGVMCQAPGGTGGSPPVFSNA